MNYVKVWYTRMNRLGRIELSEQVFSRGIQGLNFFQQFFEYDFCVEMKSHTNLLINKIFKLHQTFVFKFLIDLFLRERIFDPNRRMPP